MTTAVIEVSEEARKAAREAAELNYQDKLGTPDRPGWTWGKCPVSEYFAKIGEIGAAEYTGYGWKNLCLYSPDRADYKKPDMGDWDIKAGKSFTDHDTKKGVKYIIWVRPQRLNSKFSCGYATCGSKVHERLSGDVAIMGWTDIEQDKHLFKQWGKRYMVQAHQIRSVETLPVFEWAVAV